MAARHVLAAGRRSGGGRERVHGTARPGAGDVDHAEALLTRDPFGEAERSLAATLLREALAALDLIERKAGEMLADPVSWREQTFRLRMEEAEQRATEMEAQARLDAERAAILSAAVGRARLLLNDASKESSAHRRRPLCPRGSPGLRARLRVRLRVRVGGRLLPL